MLSKLENQPIQTVMEIRERFPDNWFRYGINNNGDIKVLYIADTLDELLSVSKEELLDAGFTFFSDVHPVRLGPKEPLEIGGVDIIAWED